MTRKEANAIQKRVDQLNAKLDKIDKAYVTFCHTFIKLEDELCEDMADLYNYVHLLDEENND